MNTLARIMMFAAAAALVSCGTGGEPSLLLVERLVPPVGDPTAVPPVPCGYSTETAEYAFATFDPASATGYRMGVIVENRMTSNATSVRPNTLDVSLTEAHITYESTTTGNSISSESITPISGWVPTGGKLATGAVLIPASKGAALAAEASVRIYVQVWGKTSDGSKVKSAQYSYILQPGTAPDSSACVKK